MRVDRDYKPVRRIWYKMIWHEIVGHKNWKEVRASYSGPYFCTCGEWMLADSD